MQFGVDQMHLAQIGFAREARQSGTMPDRGARMGVALDSIITGGCIISGGRVQNSVLSPRVRVNEHAEVLQSVLMENVVIGEQSRIRRAIIDKDVVIPPKTNIGYDLQADGEQFTVTESGIVVISKGMKLEA